MPFPQQNALAFTKAGIEWLNPNQTGCYGIFRADGTPIYIGKGDIRDRLLAHFNGDNPCILRNLPAHYLTMVINPPDAAEKALIVEFNPLCNQRVG